MREVGKNESVTPSMTEVLSSFSDISLVLSVLQEVARGLYRTGVNVLILIPLQFILLPIFI